MNESKHTPGPCQLVAYLLSNIDELCEAFDCKESNLKHSLAILNAAPALLEACKIAWNELIDWNVGDETASEAMILLKAAIEQAEKVK